MDSPKLGYDVNFQTEVPPFLRCTSCNYVLRKPMMASNCFHRFCFECMEKIKRNSSNSCIPLICPEDQTELIPDKIYEDSAIEKTILNLPVYCNYIKLGCTWKGSLEFLEAHVGQSHVEDTEADVGHSHLRDTENVNLKEMFQSLLEKLDLMQKDTVENKTEIAALKKDLAVISEESKSVRAELCEAQNEFFCLKQQFEDESKRNQREKGVFQQIAVTAEDSTKELKPNAACITNLKEETENLIEEKVCEVNGKEIGLEENMLALNIRDGENVDMPVNMKTTNEVTQISTLRKFEVIESQLAKKLELKKAENRKRKDAAIGKIEGNDEKADFELVRNVHRILNSLTPQTITPVACQMLSLSVKSQKKLENVTRLIFQRAINAEPVSVEAYSNLCRVLADLYHWNNLPATNPPVNGPINTFRKSLLSKCQREFEKVFSIEKKCNYYYSSEVFASESERKNCLEEKLDSRKRLNRRRFIGYIRFVGELYKVNMISENIIHDCIYKLLKNYEPVLGESDFQDSLEERLELVCVLFTTIGKDLDHKKAKPRMDQYFRQFHKLMKELKSSSMIKFAIKDVIALRSGGWIPQGGKVNLKPILSYRMITYVTFLFTVVTSITLFLIS